MARLTREESRAQTRERLVASATALFRREGYALASVERIAEDAGFSKGAVYSNFESKEAIFLTVLAQQGQQSLDPLLAAIEAAPDVAAVVDLLADWANDRSDSGPWSLTILEHVRLAGQDSPSVARQREIVAGHWRQLGTCVATKLAVPPEEVETLGALLHEIAYAPALTFMERPRAGDLMRWALKPWLTPLAARLGSASGG